MALDTGSGLGAANWRVAGPTRSPRRHSDHERRQLSTQAIRPSLPHRGGAKAGHQDRRSRHRRSSHPLSHESVDNMRRAPGRGPSHIASLHYQWPAFYSALLAWNPTAVTIERLAPSHRSCPANRIMSCCAYFWDAHSAADAAAQPRQAARPNAGQAVQANHRPGHSRILSVVRTFGTTCGVNRRSACLVRGVDVRGCPKRFASINGRRDGVGGNHGIGTCSTRVISHSTTQSSTIRSSMRSGSL